MFTKTDIKISQSLFENLHKNLPVVDFKFSLNTQTGRFLYDPWVIKEEFKGTVWEELLRTLPSPIGEARIIILKPGSGYQSHADIDDRYHLSLSGAKYSYLINIDTHQMYPVETDLFWYNMDAGPRHSAVNLGKDDRIQIVVRKLLRDTTIENSIRITIAPTKENLYFRFTFDDEISPWLNNAVKTQKISNFEFTQTSVSFDLDTRALSDLEKLNLKGFTLEKNKQ